MSELRQRQPIVKRRRKLSRAEREYEREAQEKFKLEVLRLDVGLCIGETAYASQHECDGPLQAHHAIKSQWLRTYVSTLDWSPNEVSDFLYSPSVGATVCELLHTGHTNRSRVIPLEWLPGRNLDFADAYRVRHILEREHPPFSDGVQ